MFGCIYVDEADHKESECIKMAIHFFIWKKEQWMCTNEGDSRGSQQQNLSDRSNWDPWRSSYSGVFLLYENFVKIVLMFYEYIHY